MGQNLNQPLPNQTISHNTQTHIEKRFIVTPHPVYTHNPDFKLLYQKITAKKYILRVITMADTADRNKMEERIFKKIANKNSYLPKLQHYIFEEQKSYCGMTTKCYLFFELGEFTTLREQILKQGVQRASFTEQQLIRGMENVLFGLLWLRFYKESHENINTLNIYYTNGLFILGDPLICPASNQNPQRYTSAQRQQKIDGQLQTYDPYVSDVFSIGMCVLEAVKLGKVDRLYKRNNKVNMEIIIEQVNKIKYPKLKDILQRILIANSSQNREKFLQIFTKLFEEKLEAGSDKSTKINNKLHTLGGSKRQVPKPFQRTNNFITANQINNYQIKSKKNHQANPSIQLQSYKSESKAVIPSVSFNKLQANTQISINGVSRNNGVYTQPALMSNYEFNRPQQKKVSIYVNDTTPIINPFERKDISKYHSVQKLIPHNQSLATPIKGYQINLDNYRKNQLLSLPISHTKSPLTDNFSNKMYQINNKYNYLSNPITSLSSYNPNWTSYTYNPNYSDYNPALKSGLTSIGSKLQSQINKVDRSPFIGVAKNISILKDSQDSSQYLFPKRISPIKKYSEKYMDKYVQNTNLDYVEIYKNKRQPDTYTNKFNSILNQYTDKMINGVKQQEKVTPVPQQKAESNSAQNQLSSANSDFSKIIDQNIMNLQNGVSAAIENSIKSLQKKPITEFQHPQKAKGPEQTHKLQDQAYDMYEIQEQKENTYHLSNLQMMKSQIMSIEGPSVSNSQIRQQSQSMMLGSNEACMQSIVNNSISDQDIQKYNVNDEVKPVQQAPKTPIRNYNPSMQLQYNRTIPEQDPAEQQSLDEMSPHKPKGQYRQLQYQNGGKYCGFVYNNQRNGEGTFYYKDGGYYQGQWKDNAMNGYGRLFYDDGSIAYQGQWHHDQFHGRGKVYNDTASQLLTSFNYQIFQDYELYWTQYDGELSHDLKQGYGKLIFSNNQFYIGKFRNDRPQGEGHFNCKNKIVKGIWAQGKLIKEF